MNGSPGYNDSRDEAIRSEFDLALHVPRSSRPPKSLGHDMYRLRDRWRPRKDPETTSTPGSIPRRVHKQVITPAIEIMNSEAAYLAAESVVKVAKKVAKGNWVLLLWSKSRKANLLNELYEERSHYYRISQVSTYLRWRPQKTCFSWSCRKLFWMQPRLWSTRTLPRRPVRPWSASKTAGASSDTPYQIWGT